MPLFGHCLPARQPLSACCPAGPPDLHPSEFASVKSNAASRPGTATCSKYIAIRTVLHTPVANPPLQSPELPRLQATGMPPAQRREQRQHLQPSVSATNCGTTSDSHTSANGSSRVRHVRGAFDVAGEAPLRQRRAAHGLTESATRRTSLPHNFCYRGRRDLDRQGTARRRPCRSRDSLPLCSPPSRRVAALRPRFAGLTALTAAPRRHPPIPGRQGLKMTSTSDSSALPTGDHRYDSLEARG